jgi:Ni,Fe-hydrogenase I large subunit
LVGGGDKAHVDADGPLSADVSEFLCFQDPEEFCLGAERNIADFIQKNIAPVGDLELARMLVAYGSDMAEAQGAIYGFLLDIGLSESALFSVLGRTAARALETQIIADAMGGWLDELTIGRSAYQPTATPTSGTGMGLNEAPRGAIGHWIDIQNQKIGNYQMVVPSTWNFGPRYDQGKPGPMEKALENIPVAVMEKPL